VLAAYLLALALAAAGQLPAAQPARTAAKVVRAEAVAGTPQTGRAYVAQAARRYLTEFPRLLAVRVVGLPGHGETRKVRFTCVTQGCALAPADQPDGVERAKDARGQDSPIAYDVDIDKGRASVRVIVSSERAVGTYIISAVPDVEKGERAVPASFTLNSR
jgi:hypothetical protein